MRRPKPEETLPYYHRYIARVQDGNMVDILKTNHEATQTFIQNIPTEKASYRYAKGKWNVKEVLLHLVDTERIMCYRALRFARNDKTALQGFDQDDFVPESNANNKSIESMIEEYKAVRASTISLFSALDNAILERVGTASNAPMSVAAIGFITCGHQRHHRDIIRERYL